MYLQSFFWQRLGFPQHDVAEKMTRDQIYRIRKEGGVEELLEKKKKKRTSCQYVLFQHPLVKMSRK